MTDAMLIPAPSHPTPQAGNFNWRSILHRLPRGMLLYYGALFGWLATTGMHIPDGYLSPVSCALMFLLVLPFWARGVRKLRQAANARSIPLIALLAAFSFVIMLFNITLPGGTSGHAVGGALAAILLGPEVASIALTVALVIQAFFFGDGGILALGANCFNMAVVLPYVSYSLYQAVARGSAPGSRRRIAGALLGGWGGLSVAALLAGVEFGIQPLLFHSADGTPLYAPFPLAVAIPAMLIPHMLVAAVVEGGVAALVVAYLQRANPAVLAASPAAVGGAARPLRAAWIGLIGLALAAPLGLLAPGTAWGEWNASELAQRGLGFVPQGLAGMANLWGAPFAGYELPSLGNTSLAYILSALLGVFLVVFLAWLFSLLVAGRQPTNGPR
jgi:cobalt/nickel transport system permease protein